MSKRAVANSFGLSPWLGLIPATGYVGRFSNSTVLFGYVDCDRQLRELQRACAFV